MGRYENLPCVTEFCGSVGPKRYNRCPSKELLTSTDLRFRLIKVSVWANWHVILETFKTELQNKDR